MSILKSFDFFQKISVENITKPTIIGSILSLSAISIMCFLLLREIYDFYTPTFVKDTIIHHDSDQLSKIHVNFNIHFYNMPCGLISVDQLDSMNNHRMDISDTLRKERYSRDNVKISETVSSDLDDTVKAVENDEHCKVSGYVDIQKVSGNIHISHHAYRQLWQYIAHARPEKFKGLTLSHKAMSMNFGDYTHLKEVFARFNLEKDHVEFSRHNLLPNFHNKEKKNYDYFIKIIPYHLIDEEFDTTTVGYQYSLNFREREHNEDELHIITFNYDFSPITMRSIRKKKYFSHFLTNICAIVGGIFVIFSILNRTYLTCCDFGKNE